MRKRQELLTRGLSTLVQTGAEESDRDAIEEAAAVAREWTGRMAEIEARSISD
jgi:hypothetical protein